jgi:hypothetical protein
LSLEVLAKRASKDERPRCYSRAVALRGRRFATAPQGDGSTFEAALDFETIILSGAH